MLVMEAKVDLGVARDTTLTWIFTLGQPPADMIAACGRQLEMGNFAWVIVPMGYGPAAGIAREMYGWDSMS